MWSFKSMENRAHTNEEVRPPFRLNLRPRKSPKVNNKFRRRIPKVFLALTPFVKMKNDFLSRFFGEDESWLFVLISSQSSLWFPIPRPISGSAFVLVAFSQISFSLAEGDLAVVHNAIQQVARGVPFSFDFPIPPAPWEKVPRSGKLFCWL